MDEQKMHIQKIAAFSDGNQGGNPAGVALYDVLPDAETMQSIAAEIGFSETAFAEPMFGSRKWRVRYFSPESEVPFCGHATIALGAALAQKEGEGTYQLQLNEAEISVNGYRNDDLYAATLTSPPTSSKKLDEGEIKSTLELFGLNHSQLNSALPPARIHGGADHYFLALNEREDLALMQYDLNMGRDFMRQRGLVTIMLAHHQTGNIFNTRNAFASGGVFEDPATGAATAAFAGYLRDIDWPHEGHINIIQGEDMGCRSIIDAKFDGRKGSPIQVSGTARTI